jgi:hypothetical protein
VSARRVGRRVLRAPPDGFGSELAQLFEALLELIQGAVEDRIVKRYDRRMDAETVLSCGSQA